MCVVKLRNYFVLSLLCLFRMRAAMKKSGEISAKDGPLTTAADDEDVWKKDFAAFKPASRKTSLPSSFS
jgi:hypothetical protein